MDFYFRQYWHDSRLNYSRYNEDGDLGDRIVLTNQVLN